MSRDIDCWNTVGVRGTATCDRLVAVAHCRNCPEYVAAGRTLLDRAVPDGAPHEWARLIAESKQTPRPGSVSIMVFRLGAEWLALKTVLLERVVPMRPVHRVPSRTNRVFQGIVNVEGELLLCFSAAEALGIERGSVEDAAACQRLLVVSHEDRRFAFPVDETLGARSLAPEDAASPPATLSNAPDAVTTSVFSIGARRVALLDEVRFMERLTRALTS